MRTNTTTVLLLTLALTALTLNCGSSNEDNSGSGGNLYTDPSGGYGGSTGTSIGHEDFAPANMAGKTLVIINNNSYSMKFASDGACTLPYYTITPGYTWQLPPTCQYTPVSSTKATAEMNLEIMDTSSLKIGTIYDFTLTFTSSDMGTYSTQERKRKVTNISGKIDDKTTSSSFDGTFSVEDN
jgi:hypothetical protein